MSTTAFALEGNSISARRMIEVLASQNVWLRLLFEDVGGLEKLDIATFRIQNVVESKFMPWR